MTGAGISAESGIPTFRGADGLWEGSRVEDVASPGGFARDPERVWRFYSMRRAHVATCKPNPAHVAIARAEEVLGDRILTCTQNIDPLHEEAGSRRVLHMHGRLFESRCSNPQCQLRPFEDRNVYPERSKIPLCGECGALIRPHICWFGEIPYHMDELFAELERCTIYLTVGTSGVVQPAASFAEIARRNGARTYYVGPEDPANSYAFQETFLGPAGSVLPDLLHAT